MVLKIAWHYNDMNHKHTFWILMVASAPSSTATVKNIKFIGVNCTHVGVVVTQKK